MESENEFQKQRETEILDFIECGAKYAELEQFSKVTAQREIELYNKAKRRLQAEFREDEEMTDTLRHISFCQRQKKPYAVRYMGEIK